MLTEAGSALLTGARRTLAEADAAVSSAQRAAAGEIGALRVGYNWSAGFETLPALGRACAQLHPDVELFTEEMRPNQMPTALRSGALDVAIALLPDVVGELSYRPIRREPVVAVLASSHPLAGEEAIQLAALADESLLFPREVAPRLHDFYVNLCRTAGFEPKQGTQSSRSRWTIGTWDASTTGLFPQSVSTGLPDGLVAVPISAPVVPLESELVWRTGDTSPAVAEFVDVASGVFIRDRS